MDASPEFADRLWRLRLRGLAAADGLEAHRRSAEARELLASRADPWLGVLRRFLMDDEPGQVYDPMRGSWT